MVQLRSRCRGAAALTLLGGLLGCDAEARDPIPPIAAAVDAPARDGANDGATHAAGGGTKHGSPERAAGSRDDDEALVLRRPPLREPADVASYHATPPRPGTRIAQAFQFDAPVFHQPSGSRRIAGLVRRNIRLAVDRWVPGEGCSKSWYALLGGGYVCTGDGFSVSSDPSPLTEALQVVPPAVDQALPYRYAKVKTPAPLYWRLPTEAELTRGATAPIRTQAQGAHFVAMDQRVTVGDEPMSRTVRGFYVRDRDLEDEPAPTMHGERLTGDDALPLAFVHVDEATLVDPDSGEPRGTAERFARFAVAQVREREGQRLVIASDGFAVAADEVRVARRRDRPDEVGGSDKWIHVDLDQQVLVAYEGDRPVLATLVSSGKAGFEPPLGLFRVHKKYTTVTMSGPDPDAGTYAVEEVPWTMYYWASYALHGAYWHDEFGHVRSHGCTNIPPTDARWLFYWSEPELPVGWHAEVGVRGPWVYFGKDLGAPERVEASARSAAP